MFGLATLPDAPANALRLLELLPRIGAADCQESVIDLFWQVLRMIGAGSGVFVSAIRDHATRTSVRSLTACDLNWTVEYSRLDWPEHDPWLRYAMDSQSPVLGDELKLRPDEQEFIRRAAAVGFSSSVVVPAPSCFGASRVGVLILGSPNPGFFAGDAFPMIKLVARELAMELHEWLLKAIRDDLLERSQIKPEEVELLRYEAAGHTSKMIAAALNTKPRTVDCWFQRVTTKLNAPDRRTAMRIARLYGLI
ncbi:helix-turn-helix transcriptional regulator [Roseateles sp. DC23W]|uniref:helix-turn-helix transcriptional regulator n=1 Tax=Pelomonas dachongensis TaxID=3299029 RepID=UPI0037493DD8